MTPAVVPPVDAVLPSHGLQSRDLPIKRAAPHEVLWMSLYFSVAVWLSIALVHSPVARRRLGAA